MLIANPFFLVIFIASDYKNKIVNFDQGFFGKNKVQIVDKK